MEPETPPQMRGTPPCTHQLRKTKGNTPADAGNSIRKESGPRATQKHPRRCGELTRRPAMTSSTAETPPQMRGTPIDIFENASRFRNTPADAGNSTVGRETARPLRKHPRRCGELSTSGMTSETISETPPQMRGTRQTRCRWTLVARNTPADAGNSAIYRISTQSNHYILRYSHIPGFRSNLYH